MPGAAESILDCLQRFGLHWDGEIDYQSQHLSDYAECLAQLQTRQQVYPCTCSRAQLADSPAIYPGFCRQQPQSFAKPYALRVITDESQISFVDALQGRFSHNLALAHGDFIVKRKDGIIAYQLAVVIDDYRQAINHVVRGCDLLESTPKQLYLQKLLGYPSPSYMHLPVIVDRDGNKLSKQTQAEAVNATHAGQTLFLLLTLLKQNPPAKLKYAEIASILEWGISHWQAERLTNTQAIYSQ